MTGAEGLRVTMPVHNAGAFLEPAVQSVLDDLPEGASLVIVDDASTDGSWDRVQRYAGDDERVIVLRNETGQGVSRSLNRGLLLEPVPAFLAVAEHDDVVLPGRFAAQVAFLREHGDTGVVGSGGQYLGPDGTVRGKVLVGPTSDQQFQAARDAGDVMLVPHAAAMYQRDAFVAVGGYDARFDSAQDVDIFNRIVYEAGWKVRTLPGPHFRYRLHLTATSFGSLSKQRAITRYVEERNACNLQGREVPDFAEWMARPHPLRTRLRWARKDYATGLFRSAGLRLLCHQYGRAAVSITVASALHPRWAAAKIRNQLSRRG